MKMSDNINIKMETNPWTDNFNENAEEKDMYIYAKMLAELSQRNNLQENYSSEEEKFNTRQDSPTSCLNRLFNYGQTLSMSPGVTHLEIHNGHDSSDSSTGEYNRLIQ